MTVLLTGATGFIGRHVMRLLLEQGHQVRAVVRDVTACALPPHANLRLLGGGLSGSAVEDVRGCDALIHLAAHGVLSGMNDWSACFRVNVTESLALWLRCVDAGVRRFVICGSCFEYGKSGERYEFIPVNAPLEPTGAYHASKAAATMAAQALAVDKNVGIAVLRPFHVFGEGEAPNRFWPSLRGAALRGVDFPMTSGLQVRDFVPVGQVAEAFVRMASGEDLLRGRAVLHNIGTGRPQTLLSFAQEWWAKFGASGRLQPGSVAARPNEVMRYVPEI
ncbi:MAG: NAD(P)-dependent oxidoreductase [Burkholderiales bacterium]|nr:NAD(P)-dependent oxidoreductase [Opitutaceae bacterium]